MEPPGTSSPRSQGCEQIANRASGMTDRDEGQDPPQVMRNAYTSTFTVSCPTTGDGLHRFDHQNHYESGLSEACVASRCMCHGFRYWWPCTPPMF